MKKVIIYFGVILLFAIACKKETNNPDPIDASIPVIDSLTATKYEIPFGGTEPTIITAHAKGGNLTYQWEVDLGDIIPQNDEASIVSFTGSPCCIGDKTIRCTVTNEKGTVSKDIFIKILEP